MRRIVVAAALWFSANLWVVPDVSYAEGPSDDIVHWDWYFRESLTAIRDWESTIQRLQAEPERLPAAVRFPVPADGRWIDWPNPVPRLLLPPEDRQRVVRVRLADENVDLEFENAGPASGRQTAPLEQAIIGYAHPGGGGKDQWYHRYERQFDALLRFQIAPAPIAISIDAPLDLGRGHHVVETKVTNVTTDALQVSARFDVHHASSSKTGEIQTATLPPCGEVVLRHPLELLRSGGGIGAIHVSVGDEAYWIPFLTHVEDVAAVTRSIDQILEESPNEQASLTLQRLRERMATLEAGGATAWREIFQAASQLRDRLLLGRITFDSLLFVKRKPYFSEQPFMDAHHLFNRPGGGIYRLSPVRPEGTVTPVVDSLGEGVYRDVSLHSRADRFLFAFGNGSDRWDGGQSYDLFETSVDGTDVCRLTEGPRNDCEPFYLPNGQVGFTSDRSGHFVMCGGDRHSPTLFVADAEGSNIRQISHNVFNDFNPTLLPDGRILYSRWEYNERSVTSLHNPFTMNPDGTMVAPLYGNATIRPNVVMFPRPVPDSHKLMALFTAHHGQTHGAIGLIDVRRGRDGLEPLELLTPGVPLMGEKALDTRYGWYSDPMPLSESTYLCSFTPTVLPWLPRSWAIYVGDRHGNLALVYRDSMISCAEPVPLVPRPPAHNRSPVPSRAAGPVESEATLVVADVHTGLRGVPRGAARFLRVLEDVPRKGVRHGGVILTSGTEIFTIKRVLGTVPVEADGSAHFTVPADRNVYFQVLDARRREIQRMRSVVCLRPGERRVCIGCHEPQNLAPPNRSVVALRRPPSRPIPPPWGLQTISFLRDVQPVINRRCVSCHAYDRGANGVILTDDLTDQFTVAYEELLPLVSAANANRWDHPDDVYPQPPYTYGSTSSPLMTLLDQGHHGVALTLSERSRIVNWIDANGVYYDRYESDAYGPKRRIFSDSFRQAVSDVYSRRCADCHGSDGGTFDSWWMTINRRDDETSRMLAAPLARSAGGWQRCGEAVFSDTEDADYQRLLSAVRGLRQNLVERPREDLLSIAGTDAASQVVELPEPPPPGARTGMDLPDGDWVFLSELPWQLAQAGWTKTGDGIPRRDRDVMEQVLRLRGRRYPKGIGTHAPSKIVYRLDGQYDRFHAVVGGAERRGTVSFQVLGDGRLLFDSGPMKGLREARTVDVSVADVRELKLVVTDAGDNDICDSANWVDARLRRVP